MKKIFGFLLLISSYAIAGVSAAATVNNPTVSSSATDLTSNWTISFHYNYVITGSAGSNLIPLWSRVTSTSNAITCSNLELFFTTATVTSGANTFTLQHIYVTTGITTTTPTGHVVLGSSGTLPLSDINYHHIAVTRSGNTWSLYIDGTLDSTATDSATQQTGCTFQFGNGGGPSCGNTFTGDFCSWAEIAGFNTVATAQQIKALSKGSTPALVGLTPVYYWPFHGFLASTMADLSGNGWGASGTPATVNHCACGMPTGEGH